MRASEFYSHLQDNRYYEERGFDIVGDFAIKRGNGTTWFGTLLKIDLSDKVLEGEGGALVADY